MRPDSVRIVAVAEGKKGRGRGKKEMKGDQQVVAQEGDRTFIDKASHFAAKGSPKYVVPGQRKYVAPVPEMKYRPKVATAQPAEGGSSAKRSSRSKRAANRSQHNFAAVPEEATVAGDDEYYEEASKVDGAAAEEEATSERTTAGGTSEDGASTSDWTTPRRTTSEQGIEDSAENEDMECFQKAPRLVALPPRPFDPDSEFIRLGLYDPYDAGAEDGLVKLLSAVSADHTYENRVMECYEALREVLRDYFQGVRLKDEEILNLELRAVGSYRQNTHLMASDLDLSLEVVTSETGVVRSSGWCAHIISGLQDYIRKQHDSPFNIKLMLLTARVPVLKLDFYTDSGVLEVDLTVETDLSKRARVLYRDDVVARLLEFADPLANTLCRLVKHWAKTHFLNSAFEGTLNSLSWALLVVSYLQQQGMIPSFDDLPNRPRPVYTDARIIPQLRGFYGWMVDVIGSQPMVIDIVHGTCVPGPATMQQPLCLKDPDGMAPENSNTAQTLQFGPWQRIIDECARSAACLFFIKGYGDEQTGWDQSYCHQYGFEDMSMVC